MRLYKKTASLSVLFTILLFILLLPLPVGAVGIDQQIDEWFAPIANWWEQVVFFAIPFTDEISIPLVLILLVSGGIFFTIYFRLVNIRKLPVAMRAIRGKYDEVEQQPSADGKPVAGELTHFQALTAALSGTVGLGNIAGVSVAIAIGGPGATFWMIISGLLGMSTKFVECTLGVKYRDVGKDGQTYGGPMYYLSKGFKELKAGRLGKVLAIIFALMCVGASLGGGNAFQSNQAVAQLTTTMGIDGSFIKTVFGIGLAILVGIVIIGGIKRIGQITEKLVPFMGIVYLLGALTVVAAHYEYIGEAFGLIIGQAFSPAAGLGGFVGVLITGFRRASFSNEAGIGSAAIAHSCVRTQYPASEGLVALLEPFIDTVVICTLTALTIIFFNSEGMFTYGVTDQLGNVLIGDSERAVGGVELTSLAFESVIPHFSIVLTLAVCLFAFSTMLSWSYYGIQSWKFLFGRSKWADLSYKVLFLVFVVIGAAATLDSVIKFSDAMILAMTFPNIIGLFLLAPKVKGELNRYLEAIRTRKVK
ncbi:alanine/glycine:cation symporter family protein [Parapedobacter sp. 10938]|uniref:alanine/glycine:cation symporter family protein n=1 Tax=Parapedobacter flavus TaxID=3110225 RepID=UPI002DB74F70|nr:alanine/glycine:cation symporter family protein [Parapedobacter sp. 10938]MEC3880373.1 alanine/glycine:cation symporter family protein [Parapedobacter sp. 10938]